MNEMIIGEGWTYNLWEKLWNFIGDRQQGYLRYTKDHSGLPVEMTLMVIQTKD